MLIPRPPTSLAMNVYPALVFNTFFHSTREEMPYITHYVSFDPKEVKLQMEETSKEIQDVTFDYLFNITRLAINILYNADEAINYIE